MRSLVIFLTIPINSSRQPHCLPILAEQAQHKKQHSSMQLMFRFKIINKVLIILSPKKIKEKGEKQYSTEQIAYEPQKFELQLEPFQNYR